MKELAELCENRRLKMTVLYNPSGGGRWRMELADGNGFSHFDVAAGGDSQKLIQRAVDFIKNMEVEENDERGI